MYTTIMKQKKSITTSTSNAYLVVVPLLVALMMMTFTTTSGVVSAAHYDGNNCRTNHRLFGSSSWGGSRMMISHDEYDGYPRTSTFPQQRRRYDYHSHSRKNNNHHGRLAEHRGRKLGGITGMDLAVDMLTIPFYYDTFHRNINSLLRQQESSTAFLPEQQEPRYSFEDYGDSGVELIMELPRNIRPNDINVEIDIEQSILTIRGRYMLVENDDGSEQITGRSTIFVRQSEFKRSFRLADDDIDIPQINVSLSSDGGILSIMAPRKQQQQQQRRQYVKPKHVSIPITRVQSRIDDIDNDGNYGDNNDEAEETHTVQPSSMEHDDDDFVITEEEDTWQ
jgi:HSP20 family molecular chaperone IbpA